LACCKKIAIPYIYPDFKKEEREFFTARGCTLQVEEKAAFIVMDSICPHLTPKGCAIYKDRPFFCEMFDGRNSDIVKDVCKWKELECLSRL